MQLALCKVTKKFYERRLLSHLLSIPNVKNAGGKWLENRVFAGKWRLARIYAKIGVRQITYRLCADYVACRLGCAEKRLRFLAGNRPKTLFFDRNRLATRGVLSYETAHFAMPNVPFRTAKRHVWENGAAWSGLFCGRNGLAVSISPLSAVLNSPSLNAKKNKKCGGFPPWQRWRAGASFLFAAFCVALVLVAGALAEVGVNL